MNLILRRFVLTAALTLLAGISSLSALPDRSFVLSRADAKEIRNFIQLLETAHYNREAVDPSDYHDVIRNYMEDWDSHHLFFLEDDADEFIGSYSEALYWNVSSLGKIDAAFEIFRRYEARTEARATWIFERLEGDFDLTTLDEFQFDRRELTWPSTDEEADAIWEDRLRYELIQELLNDLELDEAKEKIRKRYARMLKNLADIETHEVTELFLSNIAHLYDPHSDYFSAETFEDFSISMRLQLEGIGAVLGVEDDECIIRDIVAGGPADLDGRLRPDDKIIAVAQSADPEEEPVELIGMKLRKIVDLIRGERGTDVYLTIQPADTPDSSAREQVKITRDIVNLDSARARGAVFDVPTPDGSTRPIGVISLPSFYGPDASNTDAPQNSTTKDVATLIGQLQEHGIDGLVLDLRDNGGGLLSEAIDLTGLFIEQGPVVQVRAYSGEIKVDEDEDSSVRYAGPLAVLVSKYSASASEIVAGALQNYGRAVVLGDSSTHGKGTVQTVYPMNNLDPRLRMLNTKSGAAKFTIQKFYLPSGSSTQLNGVVPDIVLPSMGDVMESGERFLPEALVWDEIETTAFNGSPLEAHVLTPLLEASLDRQQSLHEFDYLQRNIAWFTARQEEESVSLNLETRIEQRDTDKLHQEKMEAEHDLIREGNYTFTEFLLTPPEEEEATDTATEITEAAPVLDEDSGTEVAAVDGETPAAEDTEEEPEPEGYARLDIHLREALRVIVDAVEIGAQPQFAGRTPLTAGSSSDG